MMMTNPVILLVLLCCAVGAAAVKDTEFHCLYDKVANNSGAMPARIVKSEDDSGKVKGATMGGDDSDWGVIRFKVFTEDINNPARYCTAPGQSRPTFMEPSQTAVCSAADILDDVKKDVLLNRMIPSALMMHSDRLLVQPETGKIVVPGYTIGYCGAMTIPQSHKTDGVADVDLILYAAAGPTGSPGAFAGYCSRAANGRPIVGAMNVGPSLVSTSEKSFRITAHEIAHALGFDYKIMNSLNIVSDVPNIRGLTRAVVTSSVTRTKARAYYNCDSIAGMELENEGGRGTALSHWERRNAKDELMAGTGVGLVYSALTMAMFEDTGYFKANWGLEESMEWGRRKGCAFLEEKCVNNGTTNYPDMFCTDPAATLVCTFDRAALGWCGIARYRKPLPAIYQYFSDPNVGGMVRLFDYCPIVERYSDGGCKNGDPAAMHGSLVGPASVCVKGEGLRMSGLPPNAVQDICVEIRCASNKVFVRFIGDRGFTPCPENVKIPSSSAFTAGRIVCPSYEEVCGGN